jgi:predicted NAD/FAD-dependent oxidoreductase
VTPAACAVVGAGPAGLAAARWLAERGLPVTVLEALPDVGGRTRSELHEGFVLDRGAAFLTSFYPRTLALARRHGVPLIRPGIHPGRSPQGQHLATPAGLVPHQLGSPGGLARFPLLPARDKARTVAALLRLCLGRRAHIADPFSMARHDTEDGRRWGRRWFGAQGYEYVVRTAVEPFFFYGAEEASAAVPRTLLRHAVGWRLMTPADGMGSLCRALAEGLDVRCDHRVRVIRREGSGYVLEHGHGSTRAAAVIVAVPAQALPELAAPMSAADAADAAAVAYVPNVRLYLGYRRRVALRPPAVTPAGPGRHPIAGITALSHWIPGRVPAGHEVVGISARGWRSRELAGSPCRTVARELLADCAALGVDVPEPDWTVVFREPAAIVVPGPGHFRRAAGFLSRARRGIHFAGDWLTGSTIEGAVRTGQLAAAAVARERETGDHS